VVRAGGRPSAPGPASPTHAAALRLLLLLHPRQGGGRCERLQTWSGRGRPGLCAPAASRGGPCSHRCWWALVAYFGLATIASLRAAGQERLALRGAALDRLGYAVVVLFHLILPVRACRPPGSQVGVSRRFARVRADGHPIGDCLLVGCCRLRRTGAAVPAQQPGVMLPLQAATSLAVGCEHSMSCVCCAGY